MSPALIIFLIFLIIPIGAAVYLSFTDWNGITPVFQKDAFQFVGFDNYSDILRGQHIEDDGRIVKAATRQKDFFIAVKNTSYYVLGVVPTQTILALILAVILNQRWLKAKGFFRTAFYFPSITSSVVISIIFMWMFTRGGLVNTTVQGLLPGYERGEFINWLDDPSGIIHIILEALGVNRMNVGDWASQRFLGSTVWEWISGPSITMSTIMILNTWTTVGTMMVIYLAALQNISGSVYEAAAMDGANAWQVFRRITVPLLRPTTFFVVTLGLIGCFQVFDQVFVISSGGPAKTTYTIAYMVYLNGFDRSAMGLAATTAILLFMIIFAFTLIQRLFVHERADV
jgi:multiple sugar transport system permease protein